MTVGRQDQGLLALGAAARGGLSALRERALCPWPRARRLSRSFSQRRGARRARRARIPSDGGKAQPASRPAVPAGPRRPRVFWNTAEGGQGLGTGGGGGDALVSLPPPEAPQLEHTHAHAHGGTCVHAPPPHDRAHTRAHTHTGAHTGTHRGAHSHTLTHAHAALCRPDPAAAATGEKRPLEQRGGVFPSRVLASAAAKTSRLTAPHRVVRGLRPSRRRLPAPG